MLQAHLASTDKTDGGSLLIPITVQDLKIPETIHRYAQTNGFIKKDEYHVTVLGKKWTPLIPENLFETIDTIVDQIHWHLIPTHNYYVLKKVNENNEEKFSIIQKMEVPELNAFVSKLSELIQQDLGTFFPHITLFTKGSSEGIGIYSEEEFNRSVIQEII